MRAALLCLIVLLVVPASASAATLVKSGTTLTYSAAAGRANNVTFAVPDPGAPASIRVSRSDDDAIQATGCSSSGGEFTCTAINRIVVDSGDGDDVVTASGVGVTVQLTGGTGNDQLRAGTAGDAIIGGDGDDGLDGGGGNDALDAGAGDDQLNGGAGTDVLIGGTGIDEGFYGATAATPAPSVTLDGVANDGVPGENDNFGADIEDVSLLGNGVSIVPVTSTLVGSAAANVLTTDAGNDSITGGAGNDTIIAAAGDDTIDARDGFADRVDCGPGNDTVLADTLDVLSASCETVTPVDVGNANDDRPPTIAWTAPLANAGLGATSTLSVNAADDRGITLVRFLDDDRVVCEDNAAPYACTYAPRGDDVGRNTLTAIAVDGVGQTTSVQRVVIVKRFVTTLSLSVRSRGSTFTAGGKIDQPATVTRKQACSGTVTVRVKSGGKLVSTKKAKLTSRCTFSVRNLRAAGTKLRFTAAFAGNDYMQPRSKTVSPVKR